MLLGGRSGDVSSMPCGVRGSLVPWANCSVGVPSCPAPPRRPAVRLDRTRPCYVQALGSTSLLVCTIHTLVIFPRYATMEIPGAQDHRGPERNALGDSAPTVAQDTRQTMPWRVPRTSNGPTSQWPDGSEVGPSSPAAQHGNLEALTGDVACVWVAGARKVPLNAFFPADWTCNAEPGTPSTPGMLHFTPCQWTMYVGHVASHQSSCRTTRRIWRMLFPWHYGYWAHPIEDPNPGHVATRLFEPSPRIQMCRK